MEQSEHKLSWPNLTLDIFDVKGKFVQTIYIHYRSVNCALTYVQ